MNKGCIKQLQFENHTINIYYQNGDEKVFCYYVEKSKFDEGWGRWESVSYINSNL